MTKFNDLLKFFPFVEAAVEEREEIWQTRGECLDRCQSTVDACQKLEAGEHVDLPANIIDTYSYPEIKDAKVYAKTVSDYNSLLEEVETYERRRDLLKAEIEQLKDEVRRLKDEIARKKRLRRLLISLILLGLAIAGIVFAVDHFNLSFDGLYF